MHRISGTEIDKKKNNLKNYSKRGRKKGGTLSDLTSLVRIPLRTQIVASYNAFQDMPKTRRISAMADELVTLWEFFNFPVISRQQVVAKLKSFFTKYENYQRNKDRQKSKIFADNLQHPFDVTKVRGTWLANEDKQFYQ